MNVFFLASAASARLTLKNRLKFLGLCEIGFQFCFSTSSLLSVGEVFKAPKEGLGRKIPKQFALPYSKENFFMQMVSLLNTKTKPCFAFGI